MKEGGEKKEYFRWNEDICGFIRTHWNKLMPDRKRTQSWRSTVAGTLSVNCPAVFQSGMVVHIIFMVSISCAWNTLIASYRKMFELLKLNLPN